MCDNGSYTFYVNGKKQSSSSSVSGTGLSISNNKIKFYCNRLLYKTGSYGSKTFVGYHYNKTSSALDFFGCATDKKNPEYSEYRKISRYVRQRDKYYLDVNCDTIIDEVRLSKGVLYTKNYTIATQPYTTNTVLVVPSNPKEDEISFKTNYDLGNVRIGGSRPTYPKTGDIFVNLDGDKVDSIQQYQETGWYPIQGSIYRNGQWSDLKGFNMKEYTIKEPDKLDSECNCTFLCIDGHVSNSCIKCFIDRTQCTGSLPMCICTKRCTSDSIFHGCGFCDDYGQWKFCKGTSSTAVCICSKYCTQLVYNGMCQVCVDDRSYCMGGGSIRVCNCVHKCTYTYTNMECPLCHDLYDYCTSGASRPSDCICDTLCTSDAVNWSCPFCRRPSSWEICPYTPPAPPSCNCDVLCTSDSVNNNCPVCPDDLTKCIGAPPSCNCIVLCMSNFVNHDCPVCPDDLTKCTGAPPICICNTHCTSDSVNNSCLVCSDDWTYCIIAPPAPLKCNCDILCTSDSVNNNCPLCPDDWTKCTGAPPAPPECNCNIHCTSDSVNNNCSVCSDDWTQCTGLLDPDNPDPDNPDNPDPDNPDPDNPDNPDPDNPDPDNPDNPDPDNPDNKDSIWDKIGKLLASLLGIIEKLISPLIDGIISLIDTIMIALGSLTNLSEAFGNFLKAAFVFIPDDILSIIGLGVMLTIFASIIKIFM